MKKLLSIACLPLALAACGPESSSSGDTTTTTTSSVITDEQYRAAHDGEGEQVYRLDHGKGPCRVLEELTESRVLERLAEVQHVYRPYARGVQPATQLMNGPWPMSQSNQL